MRDFVDVLQMMEDSQKLSLLSLLCSWLTIIACRYEAKRASAALTLSVHPEEPRNDSAGAAVS